MARASTNSLGTIPNLEKMAILKSFVWRPVYGEKVEPHWKRQKKILTLASSTIGRHTRDLSRTWEMTSDLRRVLDFIYVYPIIFGAHAKPSGWACKFIEQIRAGKHTKVTWGGLTRPVLVSLTGISIAIFSRFAMVPRPLAPTQAMRCRTCADVIQPCRSHQLVKHV